MNIDKLLFDCPHLLIGGCTGAGKSVFLKMLMARMIEHSPDSVDYYLIDLKRFELKIFADKPHCIEYAKRKTDADRVITDVVNIMDARYKAIDNGKKDVSCYPHTFLIIDEYADLLLMNGKSIRDAIARISIMGRSVRVHLIVCTQRPTKDICGLTLVNITDRIGLRTATRQDSKNIINQAGCEMLPQYGNCYFLHNGYITLIEKIPFITDAEISDIKKRWQGFKKKKPDKITIWDEIGGVVLLIIILRLIFSLFN